MIFKKKATQAEVDNLWDRLRMVERRTDSHYYESTLTSDVCKLRARVLDLENMVEALCELLEAEIHLVEEHMQAIYKEDTE